MVCPLCLDGSGRPSVLDLGWCGVAPGDDGCVTAERWWHPRERFGWRLRFRGLWRAVVGRIALRMEGVVASGGGVASWESCGACGRSRHRSASVAVAEAPRSPR